MRSLSKVGWLWVLLGAIAVASAVNLSLGLWHNYGPGIAAGVLGFGFAGVRAARRLRRVKAERAQHGAALQAAISGAPDATVYSEPADYDEAKMQHEACKTGDLNALIEQMLSQGRCALLLRPQIASQLNRDQLRRATDALQEEMALVPDGEVVVEGFDTAILDELLESDQPARGSVVEVQRVFLDRYQVTNRQFWYFVKADGYQQMALWDPEVWPAVLDFVDRTGTPGPRFWQQGKYPRGADDHPVTGVSWYEAAAYARWAGKRLPTDPEWIKAGSWPVVLSASSRLQRRYPWGDSMDRKRANLWNSGPGGVVSVREFSDGVSVGGIHQLIGNVWEWTGSEFAPDDCVDGHIILGTTMRSLRGGAYDTYFDSHATCQFATGDNPVVRKHNIGFRCALSVCDLSLFTSQQPSQAADANGGGTAPRTTNHHAASSAAEVSAASSGVPDAPAVSGPQDDSVWEEITA